MNSAAVYSARLIDEFEKQHQQEAEPAPEYPSRHPFGASEPGPFGGASADTGHGDELAPSSAPQYHPSVKDAFTAKNEMTNFADWDAGHAGATSEAVGAPDAANSTDMTAYTAAEGPFRPYQPRALTQYDYPAGWGAQTFSGAGGLTQDSASRIATLQAKLNQRLGPEYLSQRPGPGGGKKLTYIEGWKLVDLANEVFGFNGWSTTIVRLDVDFLDCSPDGTRFNAGVSCVVRVTLRDGAFHEDIGYGSAENARQKHAALEKGKKEAVTDATKRALKNFGKLLGNCTYDHQYSQNALKVSNPAPKFDASELHRRPELRPPQPPPPQPPQHATHAAPVASVQQQQQQQQQTAQKPVTNPPAPRPFAAPVERPAHPVNGNATTLNAPTRPIASSVSPQATTPASVTPAAPIHSTRPSVSNEQPKAAATAAVVVAANLEESVSERQQRSMLARQAYLERQQAEARKPTVTNGTSSSESSSASASASASHRVMTTTSTRQGAAETEFGSDSFDDGLNDVLATYDETEMGDAEAASHALEMEIDEQHRHDRSFHPSAADDSILHPNHNAADDSGVAFPTTAEEDMIRVKQEKVLEMRRSTSPVKQVKMEAVKAPRRAGSVGRFVSPPPPPERTTATLRSVAPAGSSAATLVVGPGFMTGSNAMRNHHNGTTSLSAAGGARMHPPPRRTITNTSALLSGGGGIEGTAVAGLMGGGRAHGEPVNHGFVPSDQAMRGVKRPNEGETGSRASAALRQA